MERGVPSYQRAAILRQMVDEHPFCGLFGCDPPVALSQTHQAWWMLSMGRGSLCPSLELLDAAGIIWRRCLDEPGYGKAPLLAYGPEEGAQKNVCANLWRNARVRSPKIESRLEALIEKGVPVEDILA